MLAAWTTPAQRRLFDTMHVADQRHGLDVVAAMRAAGVKDRDALVAGLLHDAGKGDTGVWPRVAYSLGQAYGPSGLARSPASGRGCGDACERLDRSCRAVGGAGRGSRLLATHVDLIRYQDEPRDPGVRRRPARSRTRRTDGPRESWRPASASACP